MKNYFNADDRASHIIVIAMQTYLSRLIESETLTKEEKTRFKTALTHIEKANGDILDRLGSAYVDRVLAETKQNDLRFVPRCVKSQRSTMSYVSQELIIDVLREAMFMNCCDCTKCDWKNCKIYELGVKADYAPRESDGCPFKETLIP